MMLINILFNITDCQALTSLALNPEAVKLVYSFIITQEHRKLSLNLPQVTAPQQSSPMKVFPLTENYFLGIFISYIISDQNVRFSYSTIPIKKTLKGFLQKTNTGYWQDYKNEVKTTEDNKIIFF